MLRVPSSTGVVEVLVLALVPDFHRLALALAGVADANAFGVEAAGAERAGAAGADPLVAAGVAFLLLFQAFLELLDQLVQAAQGLDLRPFFIRQRTLELPCAANLRGSAPAGGRRVFQAR